MKNHPDIKKIFDVLPGLSIHSITDITDTVDETISEKWISKGIPSSLKTKTKKTVAGVIKSLNNLIHQ